MSSSHSTCLDERSEIKAEMAVLGTKVENVLNNNGVYVNASGASSVNLAGTQASRVFIVAHNAATVVSGAALAVNAYHMVALDDNLLALFSKFVVSAGWVVGEVATAHKNIEKDDKKEVEKRIVGSEDDLGEVPKIETNFLFLF